MTTERRTFRPFDVPDAIGGFLSGARLIIGTDPDEFVEASSRRRVDASELRSGAFSLEIAPDESSFASLRTAAIEASLEYGEGAVELAVIVSSSYLKWADIVVRSSLNDVARSTPLTEGQPGSAFGAVHHGCDVDVYLVLGTTREHEPLQPWRKGMWLSHARFELRTVLDGVGIDLIPLTDELRTQFALPAKTLRYVALDESPLEASSTTNIMLYVDGELLSRLRREPRKNWAKAFTDQLAVDALSAIALKAVADPDIRAADWGSVRDTLLGSLIVMIGGRPSHDADQIEHDRQALLDRLRNEPLKFMALIEGALEMRDTVRLIVGGS